MKPVPTDNGLNRAGRRAAAVHRNRAMLDPAGLPRAPRHMPIVSPQAHRNVDQAQLPHEIPILPDDVLIATLVGLGCPRWFAEHVRVHPPLRFNAVATWCLVKDAQEGKMVQNARTGEMTSARDLVDAIREQYQTARKLELIHDDPGHTAGLGDR